VVIVEDAAVGGGADIPTRLVISASFMGSGETENTGNVAV